MRSGFLSGRAGWCHSFSPCGVRSGGRRPGKANDLAFPTTNAPSRSGGPGDAIPSPLVGEGASKGRMRGVGRNAAAQGLSLHRTLFCALSFLPTPLIRLGAARRSTFSHRGRRKGCALDGLLPGIARKPGDGGFLRFEEKRKRFSLPQARMRAFSHRKSGMRDHWRNWSVSAVSGMGSRRPVIASPAASNAAI